MPDEGVFFWPKCPVPETRPVCGRPAKRPDRLGTEEAVRFHAKRVAGSGWGDFLFSSGKRPVFTTVAGGGSGPVRRPSDASAVRWAKKHPGAEHSRAFFTIKESRSSLLSRLPEIASFFTIRYTRYIFTDPSGTGGCPFACRRQMAGLRKSAARTGTGSETHNRGGIRAMPARFRPCSTHRNEREGGQGGSGECVTATGVGRGGLRRRPA